MKQPVTILTIRLLSSFHGSSAARLIVRSSSRFILQQQSYKFRKIKHKLMSIPTDEEKWMPSQGHKLAITRTLYSVSPRKSRMLAFGSVTLGVMVLGGWYWYIGELPRMGHFWKNTSVGMLDNQS
jgi:hypothetical protein